MSVVHSKHSALLPIDYGGPTDRPFEPFPNAALEASVIDRFAAIVDRYADREAIRDPRRLLTYSDVATLAAAVADALALIFGRFPGPVAILLPSEARFPVAMLGALAAGRGYVPLDATFPIERNRLIAEHAGVAGVISAGSLARQARALFPEHVSLLDLDELRVQDADKRRLASRSSPSDLAYVIYTSGSTGTPKGVYQSQRNLLHDILQYTNTLHLDCEDRLTLLYSPSVAGAIPDIYGALLNGASLYVLPPRELQPAGLMREIRDRGITIYHSVPTLARRVVEALGDDERFEKVRIAYFSGDQVDWGDVDVFRRGFPADAFLYLALNSTEAARTYCHWFAHPALRETSGHLPVGREIPDRKLIVVDADSRPVPDGEIGEFVLASRYVALGYWRAEDLTARNFAAAREDPETRLLQTGDLGLRRPDGLFEFRGRKDQRVKIHGHSIEPAEIEIALKACSGIRDAAIVVRKDQTGDTRALVAYVELEPGTRGLLPRHINAILAKSLPPYMLPAAVFIVDNMPRLPNFKIDLLRLAEADAFRTGGVSERASDPLLDRLARIYEQVLGVSGATADDTLQSLGGDSLQALALLLEIEKQLEILMPLDVLEASPTIHDLARWVAASRAE